MAAPRDHQASVRRHIARGWVERNNPSELTALGEQEAEERHEGTWGIERYDVGPHGWDPGEDKL